MKIAKLYNILENLSEVVIKSYQVSQLWKFSFCMRVRETFLDKTKLSFEHIFVQFALN